MLGEPQVNEFACAFVSQEARAAMVSVGSSLSSGLAAMLLIVWQEAKRATSAPS